MDPPLQRLVLQKAFSSQQLVHLTVINLFDLNHLRDLCLEGTEQSYSPDQLTSWAQLLGLFGTLTTVCRSTLLKTQVHSTYIENIYTTHLKRMQMKHQQLY